MIQPPLEGILPCPPPFHKASPHTPFLKPSPHLTPFAGLPLARPPEASVGCASVPFPSFSGHSARSPQAPSTPYLLISLIWKLSSQGQSHVRRPGLLISLEAAEISGRECVSHPAPCRPRWGGDQGATPGGACSQPGQHVRQPTLGQWKVTGWGQGGSEWILSL